MKAGLTADAFAGLLACLDADSERAGEKYEDVRRTLIRFFEWRSAPFPEEQTDEVFNRVARKIGEGIEVRNIGSYCYEVARLVCLEALKGKDSKRAFLDPDDHDIVVMDRADDAREKEIRLACLEDCLDSLPIESRELIVEYYQDSKRDRIERRKSLAASLGLQREALANRAQRLRDKLEHCVRKCCAAKWRYE
jgi:RNA polymerase sigma factor (sigma-70 family)